MIRSVPTDQNAVSPLFSTDKLQNHYSQTKPSQLPYEMKGSVEYSGQSNGVGSGRIILKALDEPYKAYFPHTFGLKSADFLFGLM